jgi:hypothetical protein
LWLCSAMRNGHLQVHARCLGDLVKKCSTA